jgi:hypothetical protein
MGLKVIFMCPCICSIDNHYGNIHGGARMTSPPTATRQVAATEAASPHASVFLQVRYAPGGKAVCAPEHHPVYFLSGSLYIIYRGVCKLCHRWGTRLQAELGDTDAVLAALQVPQPREFHSPGWLHVSGCFRVE